MYVSFLLPGQTSGAMQVPPPSRTFWRRRSLVALLRRWGGHNRGGWAASTDRYVSARRTPYVCCAAANCLPHSHPRPWHPRPLRHSRSAGFRAPAGRAAPGRRPAYRGTAGSHPPGRWNTAGTPVGSGGSGAGWRGALHSCARRPAASKQRVNECSSGRPAPPSAPPTHPVALQVVQAKQKLLRSAGGGRRAAAGSAVRSRQAGRVQGAAGAPSPACRRLFPAHACATLISQPLTRPHDGPSANQPTRQPGMPAPPPSPCPPGPAP